MKYIVVLADGMADEPLPELGGKTPLEVASTPNMDQLAREGACGLLRTIPDGMEAGSDIANLGILGYDPAVYYTGRGPIEAASMGIALDGGIAYRCNLVTIADGRMADFSAGHITSAEGKSLLSSLEKVLAGPTVHAGVSYRNLLVLKDAGGSETTPPHDIVGEEVAAHLPRGPDREVLLAVMARSREVFADHPVNKARIAAGKPPATQVWPWSGGKTPALPSFRSRFGLPGGVISAVDLLKGIATLAGLAVIEVPGATGFLDTDYQAKARYALEAIGRMDFVFVHVEATDEAGHLGDLGEKVRAIERVDEMIGTILSGFSGVVAVLPDHPTPLRIRTHTRDPVPFVIRGKVKDNTTVFSEKEACRGFYGTRASTAFLPLLFGQSPS